MKRKWGHCHKETLSSRQRWETFSAAKKPFGFITYIIVDL